MGFFWNDRAHELVGNSLHSGSGAEESSAHAAKVGTYQFCSQAHIFGDGDTQDLVALHGGIVLHSAVAAGDEEIAAGVGADQAMQTEAMVVFYQNNVAFAKVGLGGGLHVDHFSVTNRGRHAGAASLKANSQSGFQAIEAEGFELARLGTVFARTVCARASFARTIFNCAGRARKIGARKIRARMNCVRKISHGN